MEPLHAPWRLDYVLMPKPASSEVSLFTQIAQSSDDVANLVLTRERTCFALMNAYPYTGGHLMPRWNGDTNFMPVLASTTVVPQALCELAAQLREALGADAALCNL